MWLFYPDSPFWKLVGYTRFCSSLADVARNGVANLIPEPTKAKSQKTKGKQNMLEMWVEKFCPQ
jgi:hypothetical protein